MLEGLRGLTTRGRSFLAAALAAAVSAVLLGEQDLLRVAVLLAVLPLLAAFYVGRTRARLECDREVGPHRIPVGASARVLLRLRNVSRLPTGTLLLEDMLPYALGSRPRVVLDRLGVHQANSIAYTVRPELRGRYPVGPLHIRVTDPFGLCELTHSFAPGDRLTVVPRIVALQAVALPGNRAGAGRSRIRSVAVHGEDDTATREYRRGDDLRRVHWKSTARTGELMVRREEQPGENRATIVLDTRAGSHCGEGPTASFEWMVSAAASIAVHLRQAGFQVRLVAGDNIDVASEQGEGHLLDQLADIRPEHRHDLTRLVERVRRRTDGGLVVALLGPLTPADTELVTGLGSAGAGVAFLIDSFSWLDLPDHARAESAQSLAAGTRVLARRGWRVVPVRHGDDLATIWPRVAQHPAGGAGRAVTAETVGSRR
ncbi:DUF58 domain-containing protein [Micromonosporaceae bacterium DT55]|uniref:DUF58 domain-containing protein n=1 Tax=Melissospora conviva TaxID=3388432 RepID=UPI003C1953BF